MDSNMLYNMIIEDSDFLLAREIGIVLDIDLQGDLTFSVPLSPTGELPATHWGTRSFITPQTKGLITTATAQQLEDALNNAADSRGRPRVTESLANWPNSLLFDDGDFYELIASMGLQRIENVS